MNKKIIIVAVILIILFFIVKASKAQTAKPVIVGEPEAEQQPIYEDENFIFWGSEPYTVQAEDWLSKLAAQYISGEDYTREGHKNIILDFTRSLALFNGFNWELYDNVASSDKSDPDTLQVGQIISLPTNYASKKMYPTI